MLQKNACHTLAQDIPIFGRVACHQHSRHSSACSQELSRAHRKTTLYKNITLLCALLLSLCVRVIFGGIGSIGASAAQQRDSVIVNSFLPHPSDTHFLPHSSFFFCFVYCAFHLYLGMGVCLCAPVPFLCISYSKFHLLLMRLDVVAQQAHLQPYIDNANNNCKQNKATATTKHNKKCIKKERKAK